MSKPKCKYRNCEKELPPDKIKKKAKYCNAHCRKLEYDARVLDKIRARHNETEQRFRKFHKAHPAVFRSLVDLAIQRQNRERISVKCLYEIARDLLGIRLDNTFTAFYARLLVEKYPKLESKIELRS